MRAGMAATGALLAALATACARPDGGLVFCAGGAPAEVAEWRSLLRDYEAAHPGLKVELRDLPADSDLQLQAMSSALGSGQAPYDLMRLDIVWLRDFAERGWLEDLGSHLEPAALEGFGSLLGQVDRLDGRLVALPWNVDVGLLYSRKDLLAGLGQGGPPKSMAELLALAERARGRAAARGEAIDGLLWQGKPYEGLSCNFTEAYAGAGGSMAAVESGRAWQAGPARKALQAMRELTRRGLSPANSATQMDEEACRLLFQAGKAVFMRNWPYALALLEAEGSPVRGKVWVSALPGGGALGGWHLAVRKGSPKAAAAAELAAWLSSAGVQERLARNLGWNPSRPSVYASLKGVWPDAYLHALRLALKAPVARPRLPDYAAFSERTYQAVNKYLLDRSSEDEAVAVLTGP